MIMNEDVFLQYVADNFDHNQATLLGKGTFHAIIAMAIISVQNGTTQSANNEEVRIRRCKERMPSIYSSGDHGIRIARYNTSASAM